AKKGWILDGVSTFFYRLKKDKPENLIYTIDYQPNYDEDYCKIFQDAGWTNITTLGKHIHIFSAMEGTKPIYSDLQEQAEQYNPIIKEMTRGSALFFVLTLLSIFLASKLSGWQSIFFMVLYCLTIFPFVFN